MYRHPPLPLTKNIRGRMRKRRLQKRPIPLAIIAAYTNDLTLFYRRALSAAEPETIRHSEQNN